LLPTKDFLILNKDGVNVINLGSKGARAVRDKEGQKRMLHALGKSNYLRIESTNHI
jgi:hypothetical protein